MPVLRVCGIRTFVAGDDLRCYAKVCGLLRLMQLVLLLFAINQYYHNYYHISSHHHDYTTTAVQPTSTSSSIILVTSSLSFLTSNSTDAAAAAGVHPCAHPLRSSSDSSSSRTDTLVLICFIVSFVNWFLCIILDGLVFYWSSIGNPVDEHQQRTKPLQNICWCKFFPMTMIRLATLVLAVITFQTLNHTTTRPTTSTAALSTTTSAAGTTTTSAIAASTKNNNNNTFIMINCTCYNSMIHHVNSTTTTQPWKNTSSTSLPPNNNSSDNTIYPFLYSLSSLMGPCLSFPSSLSSTSHWDFTVLQYLWLATYSTFAIDFLFFIWIASYSFWNCSKWLIPIPLRSTNSNDISPHNHHHNSNNNDKDNLQFSQRHYHHHHPSMESNDVSVSLWCRFLCHCCCACTSLATCCLLGGSQASRLNLEELTTLITVFMDYELDVTFSDIHAGLVMLAKEQVQHRTIYWVEKTRSSRYASNIEIVQPADFSVENGFHEDDATAVEVGMIDEDADHRHQHQNDDDIDDNEGMSNITDRMQLDPSRNESDRNLLIEGAHYMNGALAMYGFLLYLGQYHIVAPCGLVGTAYKNIVHQEKKKNNISISQYNFHPCSCNELVLLRQSGYELDDVLYVSFKSRVEQRPYCIAIDRIYKSIVVIIRGTLSLEDVVADLHIHPVELTTVGERCGFNGRGQYAHCGMLAAAEWVFNDIQQHGVLHNALVKTDAKYYDYKLVVTGHSLGAGVAAILAVMLQPTFPTLQCYCFSPPGCILSRPLAASECVTSFVVNCDLVARLSLESMEGLRDEVFEMIARIKIPKYQIWRIPPNKVDSNIVHARDSIPATPYRDKLERFRSHRANVIAKVGELSKDVTLVLPGSRIIHMIQPVKTRRRSSVVRHSVMQQYVPVWATPDDFLDIQLSSTMISDHLADRVQLILNNVAKSIMTK